MPGYWLLKTEPSAYSFADLQRDKKTVWDGVSNNLALKHLRGMKRGDLALIYHTGKTRAVIGTADVVSDPYADPGGKDPKLAVVDIKAKEGLTRQVSLAEIKANPLFSDLPLVALPRLSVMPVEPRHWRRILAMADRTE